MTPEATVRQTPVHVSTAIRFAEALTKKFAVYGERFEISLGGQRYIRIVRIDAWGQPNVHAFVDVANGALLKAATWAVPAKGARGDLSTPEGMEAAVEAADRFGSYLYAR